MRVHPEGCAPWLEERYAAHHAPGVSAQPNYSLLLRTEENTSFFRRFHEVYRGRCALVRTSQPWRAVAALDRALGRLADPDPTLLATRQLVVTKDDRAVLVPKELLPRLESIEARLLDEGLHLADPPFADLDADDGTVVIGRPQLHHSPRSAWDPLDPAADPPAAARPEPGRYRIATWLLFVPDRTVKRLADTRALAAALPLLADDEQPIQDRMDRIVELLGRVDTQPVWYDKADALLARLSELLQHDA